MTASCATCASSGDVRWTGVMAQCLVCAPAHPDHGEAAAPPPKADLSTRLQAAEVDLVGLIEGGIPERPWVPGATGILAAGKRHLWSAEAKTGKSIAALLLVVAIVEAGGEVVILDRENGGDETARRLRDVLAARDRSGALAIAWSRRVRYFAWPQLNGDDGAALAVAFEAADVVIFDSS